jgi:hypothetical protein
MSIDLAPEIETTLRRHAEREGVSINELLARAFPPVRTETTPDEAAVDDSAARINTLLRRWQREYGLPTRPDGKVHTPVAELFAQWDAEDTALTSEELDAEQRLWENIEQRSSGVTI